MMICGGNDDGDANDSRLMIGDCWFMMTDDGGEGDDDADDDKGGDGDDGC